MRIISFSKMCLSFLFLALMLSFIPAVSSSAAGLDQIKLTPIDPPSFCENAVAFRIDYYLQAGAFSTPHKPSLETRKANSDLILARVVSTVIENEYYAKGKGLDEWYVQTPVDASEILKLVSLADVITPAWHTDNILKLAVFLKKAAASSFLQLSQLDLALDYETPQGGYYGVDSAPIILQLNGNGMPDQVIVLFVSLTDE